MIGCELIFDVSNFFHRSYHSYKREIENFDLSNQDHSDKMVRKFVIDAISTTRLLSGSNLNFCFDDDNNYFRKQIYADYKGNREPKAESFVNCLNEIYNLFKFKFFNAIKVPNLEADDCIGLLCEKYADRTKIIISMDEDIRMLIDDNTFVLTPVAKTRTLYKASYVADKDCPQIPGVTIQPYDSFLCLTEKLLKGCKGDNIKGIAPKGFRTTKVEEIASETLACVESGAADSLEQSFQWVLEDFKLYYTKEEIFKQLQMVCLMSQYMPKNEVNEFNKIKLTTQRVSDIGVPHLLGNTRYWSDDYKQQK
jgi:5'-3' exonuclease